MEVSLTPSTAIILWENAHSSNSLSMTQQLNASASGSAQLQLNWPTTTSQNHFLLRKPQNNSEKLDRSYEQSLTPERACTRTCIPEFIDTKLRGTSQYLHTTQGGRIRVAVLSDKQYLHKIHEKTHFYLR